VVWLFGKGLGVFEAVFVEGDGEKNGFVLSGWKLFPPLLLW